jgi:hypothetical protein
MWRIVWVAGALAAVLSGGAEARRFDCRFNSGAARTGGWISEVVVLDHRPGAATALVNDAVINAFVGVPIEAKVAADTRARSTFAWEVQTETSSGAGAQRAVMLYRLNYYKDGRPATISAQPRGYDNSFTSDGTCRVTG